VSAHLRHPRRISHISTVHALSGSLLIAHPLLTASSAAATAAVPSASSGVERRPLASLTVLPPIAQWGPGPEASRAAETTLVAELGPRVAGTRRPLVLERRARDGRGGRWREVDHGRRRHDDRTVFTAPARVSGHAATYRVRAPEWRGLREVRTRTVRATAWGSPAFLDEFGGSGLDWRWEHRVQIHNPWGGRSCSKGADSAATVDGGVLRLSVLPDPAETAASGACYTYDEAGNALGDVPYAYRLNANVSTQQSADFQYGVAAARMRFHEARGQHAAFWLQPRGLSYETPATWGAEIDVVEWFGATPGPDSLVSTVYKPAQGENRARIGGRYRNPDRFLASKSDSWWRNYHVFSLEWTPEEYVFRIDGVETWRTSAGISHDPQFLILSMLSSDHELSANPDARPEHAYVDWVAFWAPPGT
jgi:hypothetical protein